MTNNVLDDVHIVPEQYMGVVCEKEDAEGHFICMNDDYVMENWYEQLINKTLSCPDCDTAEHLRFWYVDESEWEEV